MRFGNENKIRCWKTFVIMLGYFWRTRTHMALVVHARSWTISRAACNMNWCSCAASSLCHEVDGIRISDSEQLTSKEWKYILICIYNYRSLMKECKTLSSMTDAWLWKFRRVQIDYGAKKHHLNQGFLLDNKCRVMMLFFREIQNNMMFPSKSNEY